MAGNTAADGLAELFRATFRIPSEWGVFPTGSGRTALQLALKVLAAKSPGRHKVIIPSYACRGLYDPILWNRLTPVFVDVDEDLLPDAQKMVDLFSDDVLACLLVHLGGKRMRSCGTIIGEARRFGIAVIDDQCQDVGGQLFFQEGAWDADCFFYSFGIGKNLMASAGGMLVSKIACRALLDEARNLVHESPARAYERFSCQYAEFFRNGIARRTSSIWRSGPDPNPSQFLYAAMNAVDAAILGEQLKKIAPIVGLRRKNAAGFLDILRRFPDVVAASSSDGHIYTKLSVRLKDAPLMRRFRRFMARQGVELEEMYTPLHLRDFAEHHGSTLLPTTERIYPLVINIPVRPNLADHESGIVSAALARFGECHARMRIR